MVTLGPEASLVVFAVLPACALTAAAVLSVVEVRRIGDRRLLVVVLVLGLMLQHQVIEVWTGAPAVEGVGEVFETGANLLVAGAVYYVLRIVRRERQLMADLERNERRLRLISEHIDEGTYLATADFEELLYVNPVCAEIYGRSAAELTRDPEVVVETTHPEDRDRHRADVATLVADIEAGDYDDAYHGQYRIQRADGVRWVSVTRVPVENDAGTVDRVVGRVRDVTERQELERTYEQLFESVSDGLVIHEPDTGVMVEVNERFTEITGYSREELVGETVGSVTPEETAYSGERARELIDQARTEGPQLFEWEVQPRTGEPVPVEVHLRVTEVRGETRVLASVRDVSDRRRREQRLAVFNRVLRHNLRNELEVVKAHAEALVDDGRRHAEQVMAAADRLADIGDRAREVDRVMSRDPQPRALDLAATLTEAVAAVDAPEGVAVETDLPSEAPVVADGEVLEGVVGSVLDNAVRYADSTVEVGVEHDPEDGLATVVVADDGPGVPEAELASLRRGETPLRHGRGLGLWEVKWGVERLDGELSFDTGDGTTVRVALPTPEAGSG